MKAEEAKTKVCPFIQEAAVLNGATMIEEYVKSQMSANINCICEECMAWVDTTPTEVCEGKIIKKIYPKPEPSGYCARIGQ